MASVEHKWRRFSGLDGHERGAVIEAALGLTATRAGLRLAGFRRWTNVLEWLVPRAALTDFDAEAAKTAEIVARSESAAARNLFFRANCLERSLVLWWLLRRRGIEAELRIGARKDAPKFEAHAWVECNGRVFNQPDEMHLHFTPFDAPITATRRPTP